MSRRRRTGIIIGCLLLAVVLIALDHSGLHRRLRRPPASQEEAAAHDLRKYHGKSFVVVHVVDGDTLDVDARDGQYRHTRIRLLGIDAPEAHSEELGIMYFGPQATEFVQKKILHKQVTIYLDETDRTRGRYGRLLAYVQLPGGAYLNELLITEGFAYADLRFRHSFYNKYKQLQSVARAQKRGLWKDVTREQLPDWLQRERPKLLRKK
jgi:micrococcal nuclease